METGKMQAGRTGARCLAVAVIAALAGCTPSYVAVDDSFPPPARGLTLPPVREAMHTPPLPEHKPLPPTKASLPPGSLPGPGERPGGQPGPDAAAPQSEEEPDNAAAASGDFTRLQGMSQRATVALLGEPVERTDAPPAKIWHYASRNCDLNVYFYLDLVNDELRVLHYEIKGSYGADQRQQRCYSELVSARHTGLEQSGSADSPR